MQSSLFVRWSYYLHALLGIAGASFTLQLFAIELQDRLSARGFANPEPWLDLVCCLAAIAFYVHAIGSWRGIKYPAVQHVDTHQLLDGQAPQSWKPPRSVRIAGWFTMVVFVPLGLWLMVMVGEDVFSGNFRWYGKDLDRALIALSFLGCAAYAMRILFIKRAMPEGLTNRS